MVNIVASTFGKMARRLSQAVLLSAVGLSLVAAMWIAVYAEVRSERHATRAEAVAQSQALARTLAGHVTFMLRQSDHATQLFRIRHEAGGGAYTLAEFIRRGGLFDSVLPVRLELPMAVVDRHGTVVDAVHQPQRASVAGQPFFQALAASAADQAVFTTPITDAGARKWQIQVARRLNDAEGRFQGAIILMIDPNLFVDDYDRLSLDERGAMVLTSREGQLSTGRAGDRLFASDRLVFRPQRAAGALPDDIFPSAPLDGVERIYSSSDMPRYGLSAVVGVESSVAMARFERHRGQYFGMALVATLFILGMFAMLIRQSTQLNASMRAARRAQATFRAAADGSLDGFMILKAWPAAGAPLDFIIDDINQRGAAIMGLPRSALIGHKLFALLPNYRENGFFDRYAGVYASREPLEEEVQLRTDGGAARWIHHQIVPLHDGVAITARDITARKRSEIEIHTNRGFLQSLIDHLPLLICVKSMREKSRGVIVVWNEAAETVAGYQAQDVIGHVVSDVFPPGFGIASIDNDQALLDDPRVLDQPDVPLLRPDGTERYLHLVSVPLLDDFGKTEFILCIAEDVTQRREQEQSLRASEAHLSAVTNASPLGLVRADMFGNCTYVNNRFETITGLTREQSLGRGWMDAFQNDESGYMPQVFEHQRRHQEPFVHVTQCRRPDGKLIWVATKVAAIRIGGRIEGFIGSIDDITTLREAELALRESEARLRTIADTLPAMVAYIDAAQVYRFHNRAYDREFGRSGARVLGMTIRATVGEQRYRALAPYIERALAGETLVFEEHDDNDGVDRTLEVTYIPQTGDDGASVVGFHVMRQDITSQKREKKRLLKLAQADPLTGLANRAGFMQKLSLAMGEAADEGRLMALMYMDIDHFKPVNDTYGHHVGDGLLKAFSARLSHTLRATDTIARLGGDEFTIVMEKLTRREDASILAGKIVTAMQAPFELEGVTVSVSASIGLAYFSEGPIDPDALIQEADRLLYQAKQAGRNTYRTAA